MSETGHSKNIANFSQVISIVTGLGAVYNPSNPLIEVPNLQTKLTECQTAFDAVAPLDSTETLAINERQQVFEPLSKLVTRIKNAADVIVNDELFSNDLRTIARKIQGVRASKRIQDDPATPDIDESSQSISASQMSYDNRTANFAEFITLLKTNGSYAPNETELQIGTLETMLADMQAKNTAVVNADVAVTNARIARDNELYDESDGIIPRANLVKKYVKSFQGTDGPQYKQLTALKFKKP